MSIAAVLSQLKAGGYRSVGNYISRAKFEHQLTHPWNDQLENECRSGRRSAERGIGPGHQSEEFPLERLVEVTLPDVPADEDVENPFGPVELCVLSCFFLLREVEASLLLAKSVVLNHALRTVAAKLPATKADPKAVGCTRTWVHLRGLGFAGSLSLPRCLPTARALEARLHRRLLGL